jgi:hypothetical protein
MYTWPSNPGSHACTTICQQTEHTWHCIIKAHCHSMPLTVNTLITHCVQLNWIFNGQFVIIITSRKSCVITIATDAILLQLPVPSLLLWIPHIIHYASNIPQEIYTINHMWAVNALVASLDCLRSFPNVLLLTMNNLTSSVNVAFLDRADLKVSVSLPILEAWYEILKETLMEFLHVGIVRDHYVGIVWHHHDVFCDFHDVSTWSMSKQDGFSKPFLKCAKAPKVSSARSLQQLPS